MFIIVPIRGETEYTVLVKNIPDADYERNQAHLLIWQDLKTLDSGSLCGKIFLDLIDRIAGGGKKFNIFSFFNLIFIMDSKRSKII